MAQDSQGNGERIPDHFSRTRNAFRSQSRLNDAEPQNPGDRGGEAGKLAYMVSALLCSFIPAENDVWTRDTQDLIASVLKPLIEKYGWTVGSLPPEIRLLLETGPTLLQSGKLLSQRAAPQAPARTVTPHSEEHKGADGRRKSDRRSESIDRRAAQAQNVVRPYRWNQFDP